jgi:hypothetical protein
MSDVRPLHHKDSCYFYRERNDMIEEFREINKSVMRLDDKLDNLEYQVAKLGQDLYIIKSALTKLLELKDQTDPSE